MMDGNINEKLTSLVEQLLNSNKKLQDALELQNANLLLLTGRVSQLALVLEVEKVTTLKNNGVCPPCSIYFCRDCGEIFDYSLYLCEPPEKTMQCKKCHSNAIYGR